MSNPEERCSECGHTGADHDEGFIGGHSSEHGPLCHTNTHSCYHQVTVVEATEKYLRQARQATPVA